MFPSSSTSRASLSSGLYHAFLDIRSAWVSREGIGKEFNLLSCTRFLFFIVRLLRESSKEIEICNNKVDTVQSTDAYASLMEYLNANSLLLFYPCHSVLKALLV